MNKLIKIIAATAVFLGSTAAACQPPTDPKNGPKNCFSDTGSDKPMFIAITMTGGTPPWQATGYAKDLATGNKVEFDEVITSNNGYTKVLSYISGCKVEVYLQIKNNKPGFGFIRADDGPNNGCRIEENYAFRPSCQFVTNR